MADSAPGIRALRASHDRFVALVDSLDSAQVTRGSYDTGWTIADVASHLGSGAEIFGLFLDAALTGGATPGGDLFGPVWDRWNALPPAEQVSQSIGANERFVARLESLGPQERDAVRLELFGSETDLTALAGLRLSEHAVHVWDIEVALDPAAELAPDAVDLLIDRLSETAAQGGRAADVPSTIAVRTADPDREFLLVTGPDVTVQPGHGEEAAATLALPAAAFIRLVYGRLDAEHTPAGLDQDLLASLRPVFPGV